MSIHSDGSSAIASAVGATSRSEKYVSMRDLLRILRRRRMTIIMTVVTLTALAGIVSSLLVPKFTAQAEIMINARASRVVNMQAVLDDLPNDVTTIETQIRMIRSRHYAERVAEQLGLRPGFASMHQPAAPELWLDSMRASAYVLAQRWMPERWLITTGTAGQLAPAPPPTSAQEAYAPDAVVDDLLDNLRVDVDGTLVTIGFTAADPDEAARIANAYAVQYVDDQLRDKTAATEQAASWLGRRIQELREDLSRSENAIAAFRADNDLMDLGGQTAAARLVADITSQLSVIQSERTAKEARLKTLQSLRSQEGNYQHVLEMVQSPVIDALREQDIKLAAQLAQLSSEFGERHPEIVRLTADRESVARSLRREVDSVIGGLQREVGLLRAREQEIHARFDQAQSTAVISKQAEVRLRDLEREAEANRALYATFLARYKETNEQKNLIRPDARVVALATVPTVASFPRIPLVVAGGFVTSMLLGTLLAFLAEQLDGKLRSADQIERLLGIRNLGMVPKVGGLGRRPGALQQYLHKKPLSAYAESVREVEGAIKLAATGSSSSVILVTSSLPNEGKTTFALSLATAAALSGVRTVVLDLDFRNPSVFKQLASSQAPDLTEYLTGSCSYQEVVQVDDRLPNLHALPVKRPARSPTTIVASPRLGELITLLRSQYDWVVLDTPPLLGLTDVKAMARHADHVVYAVRWGKTTDEIALNGLRALRDARANLLGSVLTQVNLRRHARLRYGDASQYYKFYKKYYVH